MLLKRTEVHDWILYSGDQIYKKKPLFERIASGLAKLDKLIDSSVSSINWEKSTSTYALYSTAKNTSRSVP